MRKKIFPLTLIGVILGILVIISPVSATPPEKERFSLWDDVSGERMEGEIEIDRVNASYSTQANVGEQKGKIVLFAEGLQPIWKSCDYHMGNDTGKQEWTSAFQWKI